VRIPSKRKSDFSQCAGARWAQAEAARNATFATVLQEGRVLDLKVCSLEQKSLLKCFTLAAVYFRMLGIRGATGGRDALCYYSRKA
jgi:hypothetical protein